MKETFARMASLSILAVAMWLTSCAGEKPADNATSAAKKSTGTVIASYETAEQIKAMLPCKATVEEHHSCYSIFRSADGKQFSIGSPAATQEVVQFLETLKEGQNYKFPSTFLDYQKKKLR